MSSSGDAPISVADLRIGYRDGRGPHTAVVHGVSFEVRRGTTLALVGQSGSGKSTIAHAIAGMLPANGRVLSGTAHLHGREVTRLKRKHWRTLHGSTIGFVPQDPLSSLDPLVRVGCQIAQGLAVHGTVPRPQIAGEVVALLERVGIEDPAQRARSYPHELSGGQLQRVLIAIALAARPSILVADEPTSALDVTVQKRILDLLGELGEELGLATLLITHDLALAHERSDRIVVLNEGDVQDHATPRDILERPSAAYTARLLSDAPVHSLDKYADRAHGDGPVVASAHEVTKVFGSGAGAVTALDAVSLSVRRGSIHALVGESGSGKTTLARILAGLTGFSGGEVTVLDRVLPSEPCPVNRHARDLQLVYQNPLAAVDPRYPVRRIVEEPLLLAGRGRAERRRRVGEILDQVALPSALLGRRPRELSGGQRQRVAVARALVLAPQILVLDEPTSALDVTVQAQIIDLLIALQREQGLTYLFISHDLSLVRQISDRISVLEHGRLVEHGVTREVFAAPQHAYTERLLDAVPGIDRRAVKAAA
jgi:peptide/nickel transport system ATP-binding protein